MKILHLSTYGDREGAARGAAWLHRGLLARGVDSRILAASLDQAGDAITVLPRNVFTKLISRITGSMERLIVIRRKVAHTEKFSAGFHRRVDQYALLKTIGTMAPDLIHLHWVAGGFVLPQTLTKLRVPIVWTLRDLWPLTGGCHYPMVDCVGYRTGCTQCPMFENPLLARLPAHLLSRKQRLWRELPLTIVALSHWGADCVRQSQVFAGRPLHVIHNAVDTDVFFPEDQTAARRSLGLRVDQPILIFGAVNGVGDRRKGFQYIRQGIERGLLNAGDMADQPHLVTFGAGDKIADTIGEVNHTHLGPIASDTTLRRIYAAADLTVMPSEQETFGKVAIESLACGTPVVSFDTSGLRDIVLQNTTGYRAACFDVDDLFHGIRTILSASASHDALRAAARADALSRFSIGQHMNRHLALYEQVITETCRA